MSTPSTLEVAAYALIAGAVYLRFLYTPVVVVPPLTELEAEQQAAAARLKRQTDWDETSLPTAITPARKGPSATANKQVKKAVVAADMESLQRAYVPGYAQKDRK